MDYPESFTIEVQKVGDVYVAHSPEIPLKIGDDEDVKVYEQSIPLVLEAWVNMAILKESQTFFSFATRIIDRILGLIHLIKTKRERTLEATIRVLERQIADKIGMLHSLPTAVTYTIPHSSTGASSWDNLFVSGGKIIMPSDPSSTDSGFAISQQWSEET